MPAPPVAPRPAQHRRGSHRASPRQPVSTPSAAMPWRWREQAACRGLPTNMFFHPRQERGPQRRRRESEAIAVCRKCPVITECRAHAEWVPEHYGIWGGLTEDERHRSLRAGASVSTSHVGFAVDERAAPVL